MFGFFRKQKGETLVFETPAAAFAYACEHLENRLLLEAVVPALVEEKGKIGEEGERYFRIRLANREGGRELWACTLKESTEFPDVGDMVGFKVVRVDAGLPAPYDVLGYIALKLETVLVGGKGWRIAKNYTPDNIKPIVHF